jgi:hypothetical protein
MERRVFTWNFGKNTKLKETRGVPFEEVFLRTMDNAYKMGMAGSESRKHNPCFLVRIRGELWVVPFKESGARIHLFTIFLKG